MYSTDNETESIDIVLNSYGDKETYDLCELTHSESPWKDARAGLPEGVLARMRLL